MSYSGSGNWSRYSSPFSFSSDSRNSGSRGSPSSNLGSYHTQSRKTPSVPSSSASSYVNSIKSHPSSTSSYSSRGSSASSVGSSGYSSSSGSGYLMGHYVVSPISSSSSSARERDYRSTERDYRSSDREYNRNSSGSSSNTGRSGSSSGGSLLPSQYSRFGGHQRTYSGTYDRKPASRPSSLYETRRSLRSYDSEYTQTPAGNHAVVHQFKIRPNVNETESRKEKESNRSTSLSRASNDREKEGRRESTSSVKNVTSKPTYVSSSSHESRKEKKGFMGLRKRLSASLSSLVSSLGSLSYSAQDLSTSSADINVVPSPTSSAGRYRDITNNDDEEDDETEYSDSVSWSSRIISVASVLV
jgi:hypothetical protein